MHVAFILDWNRRWAKKKLMPKAYGHKRWVENLEKILWLVSKHWIKVVTAWALSTENMKRSKDELNNLFGIFETFCKKTELFNKNQIKFTYIWDISSFPDSTKQAINDLKKYSKDFDNFHLQVALNYWWKDEIVRSVNKAIKKWEEVNIDTIWSNLDTCWIQDPEIIIRTWGYQRLSWFMMWQAAYSELYFTETLWPDFNEKELVKVLEYFKETQRNFGK